MRVITSDRMFEEVRKQVEANYDAQQKKAPFTPIIFGGPSGQEDVCSVAARALEDIL